MPGGDVRSRFKAFRERHHLAFEVAFFFAGFLIHQGIYLLASAGLIFIDHRIAIRGVEPSGWWGRVIAGRLWAMHFFLGTLLNAFLVFYFRSSSGFFAMVFLVALAGVIVLNELPQFRNRGPVVRVALLSFSTTSYLAYLIPVLWGELRQWQYLAAVAIGSLATWGLWWLFKRFTADPGWTVRRAVVPGLTIQALLAVLYVVDAIPPVPLSLKHIGLYHSVEADHSQGRVHYSLSYEPAGRLRFWQDASTTFTAAQGERAWAFIRVFAPARFEDAVSFAWQFDDPQRGWVDLGKPYVARLSGGNEEGYRTFAYVTLQRAGAYRVRVLTADAREIGRETFKVTLVSDVSQRVLETLRD